MNDYSLRGHVQDHYVVIQTDDQVTVLADKNCEEFPEGTLLWESHFSDFDHARQIAYALIRADSLDLILLLADDEEWILQRNKKLGRS